MSKNNQVILQGFVGNEPEQRTTQSGTVVTNFRLAVSNRYFDRNTQQWVEQETTWLPVICWRELGQKVMTDIAKGYKVLVTGKIVTSSYDHKSLKNDDGSPYKVHKTEIQGESVERMHHEKRAGGYQPNDADYKGNPDSGYQQSYDDFDVGDLGPPLDMNDNPLSPGD